jgi:uncharacterized protein involved in exopolysaccharide biosynthesis/Mrp family chromosome partitioning ATPase
MSGERESSTLADYWSIIKRRWRVVVVTTVVVGLLATAYTARSGASYASQASVVIRPILANSFEGTTRIDDVGASTEAKVVNSTVVARLAAKRLHENVADPRKLLSHVTVDNPLGTLILNISFAAGSPEKARTGAQAFADAYLQNRRATAEDTKKRAGDAISRQRDEMTTELNQLNATIAANVVGSDPRTNAEARKSVLLSQISQLEQRNADLQAVDTDPGQVIQPAALPTSPSGLPIVVTLFAAFVFGAILGCVLALVRERTDKRIRSRQSFVDAFGSEPLADIPGGKTNQPVPAYSDPSSDQASAYRRLRVRVWPRRETGPQRVLVTAPVAGAASDSVASNLAITIAHAGWRALLAWPDRGTLTPYFQADPPPPVEVFAGELPIEKLLVQAEGLNGLTLLPSLSHQADPGGGTDANEVADRLAELATMFDVEILVGAPVLSSAQSLELSPLVDGAIVVFDPNVCDRAQLERAVDALSSVGTEVLGVVAFPVPAGW